MEKEKIASGMCLPCFIKEHGIDAAIEDFGIDRVFEATRNRAK